MGELPFKVSDDAEASEAHHWVCASTRCRSTLLLSSGGLPVQTVTTTPGETVSPASPASPESEASIPAPSPRVLSPRQSFELSFYDFEGVLANQIHFSAPRGGISVLELAPCLTAVRRESGLIHSHLKITSAERFFTAVRVHHDSFATELGGLRPVERDRSVFLPLLLHSSRYPILVLVNPLEKPSVIKCRLYVQNRAPDVEITVPPRGSKVFFITTEFADFLRPSVNQPNPKGVPCYLRLTGTGGSSALVQLFEESQTSPEVEKALSPDRLNRLEPLSASEVPPVRPAVAGTMSSVYSSVS